METAAKVEAALDEADDGERSDRLVLATATDPRKALADIAQQRAADRRRRLARRAAQGLLLLALLAAALIMPRFRERSLAAAPARVPVPQTARAVSSAPTAPSTPIPPAQVEATAPPVSEGETASARCEDQFKAHQWRSASTSCAEAFDSVPSPAVAMRTAHAHWAHGDPDGARTWAVNALELGSQDPDAYVLIGNAEQMAGKRQKAIAAYRQYLQRAPRGWHAERLRDFIRGAPAQAPLAQ